MIRWLHQWWRARQTAAIDIPEPLWISAEHPLTFLHRLGDDDRMRLRQLAREFIADKQWTGAQDFPLTPDIQITIALQACLPILNLDLEWYSDWVGIVIYPGDFLIPRQLIDEDGVVHEYDDEVVGEAWYGGPVLISWLDHAETTRAINTHGINVVIHEFAHKLDMRSGAADGMPPLHAGMSKHTWISTMNQAFDDFQRRVDHGAETALDPYAAEHPAEFFAVASEAFFETPEILRDAYPDVYAQLALFYRQSPV